MPTTEPSTGWPIPEDGDPLADGAAAMRALAGAQASQLAVFAGQSGDVLVQWGKQGVTMDGTEASGTVSFPVAFDSTPVVVATARAFAGRRYVVTLVVSSGSFTYYVNERTGQTGQNDATFHWVAIGAKSDRSGI